MQDQRPLGITLLIIWAVIMGGFIFFGGLDYWKQGANGINSVSTDPDPQLIQSWSPEYQDQMLVGMLWMLGGLGFWAAAFGLWNSKEWGRKAGLLSGGAIVAGWVIIKIVSLSWGAPPTFISLLVGLPMLYLLTEEVRDYCQ